MSKVTKTIVLDTGIVIQHIDRGCKTQIVIKHKHKVMKFKDLVQIAGEIILADFFLKVAVVALMVAAHMIWDK